jgi:hypothetical protein
MAGFQCLGFLGRWKVGMENSVVNIDDRDKNTLIKGTYVNSKLI